MSEITRKIANIATVGAVSLGMLAASLPAVAASGDTTTLPPTQTVVGSWLVSDLSAETAVKQIEAFKVSRDFVAWTELDSKHHLRKLYAFDGVKVTQVAAMTRDEWDRDADQGFFDSVEGNFDLNDGLLVWTATDGLDREIWSFDGTSIRQVSNNTYDDAHPVTSRGRVAWTSYPGSAYNLMVSDRNGTYRVDGWHVPNYAFSGDNLYWMNRLPDENWFRVFRHDGSDTLAVGKGDDRPMTEYFLTDGQGNAAWEYSTKQWSYDKRETFISYLGGPARRIVQRDVPPNVTRLEDISGPWVLMNVTDLMQSSIWNRVQLIRSDSSTTHYPTRFRSPVRARYFGNGLLVRHRVPDTASALLIGDGSDTENFILNEHVIHDRFEAGGGVAAGALLAGGLLLHTENETLTVEPSAHPDDQVQRLALNGCVAWIEGNDPAAGRLRSACPTVAVSNGQGQIDRVAGRLVKSTDSPSVYLEASNGQRYLFPSESEFYGWYSDFHSVRTVSPSAVADLRLAGNALLRPGSMPVKIASSPRVYHVADNGLLRWVTSGDTMTELYGADWVSRVRTVSDSSLAGYRFGQPICNSIDARLAYVR